ncbi:MAG: hypothetical protein SWH61_04495 [Thermodesulfobacteriota bacterium]|nr:hypothetical protein [Thermodesulfobacteriota bacterium]
MTSQQSQLDVFYSYINLFIRRYRLIAICLFLAVSVAYPYYLKMPNLYQSSASIIFQEQNINPSRMSPDEEMRIEEMVNTVTQQVLSRKNLEQIINRFDLYPSMRQNVPIENVMKRMRESDVSVNVARRRGNVFSVSYQGKDPQTVKKVTDTLAVKFIEENMRMREERAKERATYIREELQMSKEKLRKKEAQMRDYKQQYYNEMPDQRADNMQRLNSMQERLQEIQANIHNLEQTRLLVSEQISLRRAQLSDLSSSPVTDDEPGSNLLQELAEARAEREALMAKYTEVHPSVRRIEKRIKGLEAEVKAAGLKIDETGDIMAQDSRIRELRLQLRGINLDLAALRRQKKEITDQIETYQKWIDAAPVREAEWSALTRDYQELRDYHDELVSQSLAAEAVESLEQRQRGSRFKVIDPAFLPQTPVKGSFLKILALAVFAGLAAGCGLVVGLDFLESSFKNEREIESLLQIPVTCTLPIVATESEKKRNKKKAILWNSFFVVWALAIMGTTAYLYKEGNIIF